MTRPYLIVGPVLLLASCALATAQDSGLAPSTGSIPSADLLLSLGPYGALVWGAYLLGKGLKVTAQVELSERDRALLERLGREGALSSERVHA